MGKVEIMRQCGDVFNGAKLEGCFDLKGFAGSELQMDGQFCFCDGDDCNKETCDPTRCDCVYSDPDSCVKPTEEPTTKQSTSTIQTSTTTSSSGSIFHASIYLFPLIAMIMF